MTTVREFTYLSADKKTQIHAMEWAPAGEPVAAVQLVHGMQEFIERYDHFARYLCDHGILVVANDHLGHGASVGADKDYGYFAEDPLKGSRSAAGSTGRPVGGNKALITDLHTLHMDVMDRYPHLPYFMLGHSMGSFLARQYICLYGKYLDGAIISGTAWHTSLEANFGMFLCKFIANRKGWHYRSTFVDNLAGGSFNKRFEPSRTPKDWLSRDERIVDEYIGDKRTQFIFTLNGYYNMFKNLNFLTKEANISRIPKTLPVLFIAGEMDPVGNFGEGPKKAALQLQRAGLRDVSCTLYPYDRHEVLNELDKETVYNDVLTWIKGHIKE